MTLPVRKAVAYVVHGGRLLVFQQPESPEAGLQVPAGTVEVAETPLEAVLREAEEETGLAELKVHAPLGVRVLTPLVGDTRLVERHFFHLGFQRGDATLVPETWRHHETRPSEGPLRPIPFDFRWVPLDDVPPLAGELGALLGDLRRHVGAAGSGAW